MGWPSLVCLAACSPLNTLDYVALAVSLVSLVGETIADEQQWRFQVSDMPVCGLGAEPPPPQHTFLGLCPCVLAMGCPRRLVHPCSVGHMYVCVRAWVRSP